MRVIAGDAKGRRIKAPTGSSIRPSSEKVRSAIFSIVQSAGVDLSRVLEEAFRGAQIPYVI
ncbi:MAG: RsmD family RNA methyltransferase, partial [Chloroflexi bacterium]|nr:RsmD family RNA methyltransferase [Chloroflexota bacterium]